MQKKHNSFQYNSPSSTALNVICTYYVNFILYYFESDIVNTAKDMKDLFCCIIVINRVYMEINCWAKIGETFGMTAAAAKANLIIFVQHILDF